MQMIAAGRLITNHEFHRDNRRDEWRQEFLDAHDGWAHAPDMVHQPNRNNYNYNKNCVI